MGLATADSTRAPRRLNGGRRRTAALHACVQALLGCGLFAAAATAGEAPPPGETLLALERDVQAVVDRVLPSVVEVTVYRLVATDPLAPHREATVLSGFVWSAEGQIVSLGRVFESAESLEVRVGGHLVPAQLLGVDPQTAIALLAVAPAGLDLQPVRRGDSAQLRRGSIAISLGCAYGLHGAVALGVVAGTDRAVVHEGGRLEGLLQLSSPVGPGDPGGPVANARGEVVAVLGGALRPESLSPFVWRLRRGLQAWLDRLAAAGAEVGPEHAEAASGDPLRALFAGQAGGVGYAVPVGRVEQVVARLAEQARRPRAWLGLRVLRLDAELARRLGVQARSGALVLDVIADSPAAHAGLRPRDVLERFGEDAIDDVRSLKRLVQRTPPGQTVRLGVLRGGRHLELKLTLGAQPAPAGAARAGQ